MPHRPDIHPLSEFVSTPTDRASIRVSTMLAAALLLACAPFVPAASAQSRGADNDLKINKTNNTSDQFNLTDGSFTWSIVIEAAGTGNSDFPENSVVLRDELPTSATYGAPSVVQSGVTGTLACSIDGASDLTCTASGGAYKMPAGSSATVSFSVTPSVEGTLANPRAGGVCSVDPDLDVPESNDNNNACSDSVQVIGIPDLIANKTNDAPGGEFELSDGSFNWSITVSNIGTSAMVWTDGQLILADEAPDSVHDGVTYGAPQITAQNLVTGTISCSASDLSLVDPITYDYTQISCTASGQVSLGVGGSFTLTIAATPSSAGVLENPIPSGFCGVVTQLGDESDANNNECSNSVTVVSRPDLTATKTNDVGGSTELADGPFTWQIVVANEGSAPAVFGQNKTLLLDGVVSGPHPDVLYAEPMVTATSGVTGEITCLDPLDEVDEGYFVQCLGSDPSGVTIDPGGSFTVEIEVTPLVARQFVNPYAGGTCKADFSSDVVESDENNNDCSDTVDVADSPDATATKTNDADGVVEVGVPFTWTILIENIGGAEFVVPALETVLVDELPEGLTFGSPTVTETTSGDLAGTMTCTIDDADVPAFAGQQALVCLAESGGIGIVAGGSVAVEWTATPTVEDAFDNPEGVCVVDPDDVDAELDENNNDCADRVGTPIFADGFEDGNTLAWN